MSKLTIHQIADREAPKQAAAYINPKTGRAPESERRKAYDRTLTRLAQEIESGTVTAWASALSGEPPIGKDHPLMSDLRRWLIEGRKVKHTPAQSGNVLSGTAVRFPGDTVANEDWTKRLYIADDESNTGKATSKSTITKGDAITHGGERAAVARLIGALVTIAYKPEGGLSKRGLISEIQTDIHKLDGFSCDRKVIEDWVKLAAEKVK